MDWIYSTLITTLAGCSVTGRIAVACVPALNLFCWPAWNLVAGLHANAATGRGGSAGCTCLKRARGGVVVTTLTVAPKKGDGVRAPVGTFTVEMDHPTGMHSIGTKIPDPLAGWRYLLYGGFFWAFEPLAAQLCKIPFGRRAAGT